MDSLPYCLLLFFGSFPLRFLGIDSLSESWPFSGRVRSRAGTDPVRSREIFLRVKYSSRTDCALLSSSSVMLESLSSEYLSYLTLYSLLPFST